MNLPHLPRLFWLLLVLASYVPSFAQSDPAVKPSHGPAFDAQTQTAFEHFYNMDYDRAAQELEKVVDKHSTLYGKTVDAAGDTVKADADARRDLNPTPPRYWRDLICPASSARSCPFWSLWPSLILPASSPLRRPSETNFAKPAAVQRMSPSKITVTYPRLCHPTPRTPA